MARNVVVLNMKLLLTGSSGPKVAATVATHLAQFHAVFGVDNASSPTTSLVADMALTKDWKAHLRDVDAVIHFDALHRETHIRLKIFAAPTLTKRVIG